MRDEGEMIGKKQCRRANVSVPSPDHEAQGYGGGKLLSMLGRPVEQRQILFKERELVSGVSREGVRIEGGFVLRTWPPEKSVQRGMREDKVWVVWLHQRLHREHGISVSLTTGLTRYHGDPSCNEMVGSALDGCRRMLSPT